MKEFFTEKNFRDASLVLIGTCNDIIEDYQSQGYSLTLRQLYYQLVSRDIIENTERSYKNVGKMISDARLAGLIDWDALEDRTRSLTVYRTYTDPAQAIQRTRDGYQENLWLDQPYRVEVWVEKEALIDVIDNACDLYRVPFMACRGYMSQSEQYAAAKRCERVMRRGGSVVIIHLGDHDPSGIDMTRDNQDRLDLMSWAEQRGGDLYVQRIALNMDQIEELKPPPNPAKVTDSRAKEYIKRFGRKSWELDALEPSYIKNIIHEHVSQYIDFDLWNAALAEEEANIEKMDNIIERLEQDDE